MQAVAAAGGLGDQVLIEEIPELPAGDGQAGVVEGGRGVAVDVGARVQAEPAEQPLLAVSEIPVGQVERGCDRQVFGLHQLQPVLSGG